MRSIRLSPKYVFVSASLLLVLLGGAVGQIAAQSTVSVQVTVASTGPDLLIDVLVNGVPFCIQATANTYSSPFVLVGNAYEGSCPGNTLVGPFTGTLTVELGSGPNAFIVTVVFDVGGTLNLHSESKFTGDILIGQSDCALENWVSQYTFVTGPGLDVKLQLESVVGPCSFSLDDTDILQLPTFIFGTAEEAVGGVVIPANTFALVSPWLAVIGLVGCISTVVVVSRKRRS